MPFYEYKCPKCKCEFLSLQSVDKRRTAKCPKCGTKAEKLPSSGVAFHDKEGRFHS